ncbi:unnamed protein product [Rhizophagus irregularis]|nr:unnamed protein product [Rhizophagus irregularis]
MTEKMEKTERGISVLKLFNCTAEYAFVQLVEMKLSPTEQIVDMATNRTIRPDVGITLVSPSSAVIFCLNTVNNFFFYE